MGRFVEKVLGPFVLPFGILALIILAFVAIGELFIGLFVPGDTPDRLNRPELWTAIGILLGVIAIIGFLSTRPQGSLGLLEKEVAIGSRPLWSEDVSPAYAQALRGEAGTIEGISTGYTLYAQSGAIARVVGILPGGKDYGKTFRGFLYSEGLGHSAREMWIPVEAVIAVYPESQSALLAIKGDETESFGWTSPPESITIGAPKHQSASDRVK